MINIKVFSQQTKYWEMKGMMHNLSGTDKDYYFV